MSQALVGTDWLAEHLHDEGLRLVDVRWYLDPAKKGSDAYAAGHLPGAVFMDAEHDLAGPGGRRGGPLGRHPWPSVEQVERVMSAAGIGPGARVIAYDDQSGAVAARLWFLLRAHGHDAAAVLDGGIAKWLAEGRPVTTDVPTPARASFHARLRPELIAHKPDMLARPKDALVLDARLPERYRGEVEPIDPRAGHVPGARSAPFSQNLTQDVVPVFKPGGELRAHYSSLGAHERTATVYCGSGITACHDLLALHLAGLPGRLYTGSWSEWSSDPSLPLVVGPEP